MTLTVPLEAAPASPIMDVPSIALLILAIVSLAFASVAQSVEQAVQRLTLAGASFADRLSRLSHLADPVLKRLRSSRPAPEPTEAQVRAELISDLREIVDEVGEPESFEEEDRDMVRSVLDLGHTLVR